MSGDESIEELRQRLQRAERELEYLRAHNRYLRGEIQSIHDFDQIIGASAGLTRVLENVARVAPTDATVLIWGETGTGKELIARAIHAASRRSLGALIKLDCAALRDQEAALDTTFALAHGGTLFLDEIGGLSLESQAELLRILQRQESDRVSHGAESRVDVRIVATTNRDLRRLTHDAQFREDLYYRLNVFPVELPPLRARAEDITLLVQLFVRKYARRTGHRVDGIDPDTLAALTRYPWPGNVRELENLVERALLLNTSPLLKIPPEMLAQFAPDDRGEMAAAATGMHRVPAAHSTAPIDLENTEITGLHHVQREHILRVLNATHWVIEGNSGAALKLGMKPATLRHRMKKLGISRAQVAPTPESGRPQQP
ncbi:MAG: sigma 54-interacting transcriptional regulator [Pseudomonadota bacterium]